MAKSVKDLTNDELKELMNKAKEVLDAHNNPKWVSVKVYTECVNILNAGQQQCQKVIQVEGKAPLEEKDVAKEIKNKLSAVFEGVREKEIDVGASYGVGTKMGVIAEAN